MGKAQKLRELRTGRKPKWKADVMLDDHERRIRGLEQRLKELGEG